MNTRFKVAMIESTIECRDWFDDNDIETARYNIVVVYDSHTNFVVTCDVDAALEINAGVNCLIDTEREYSNIEEAVNYVVSKIEETPDFIRFVSLNTSLTFDIN